MAEGLRNACQSARRAEEAGLRDTRQSERDAETWARGVHRVLHAPEAAVAEAEALRMEMARLAPWSAAVDGLLDALGL
ncbi:hypothetical protein [Streptomyces lichenis]|uniref:hypothetical protein n=1 Tax=Streptomyces lichenis TaxID=2306967 RepID=UPI0035578EA6